MARPKIQSKSWNIVLDKLIVPQLFKKFPAFYTTIRFITVLTRTYHWTQSYSRWINSTPLPIENRKMELIMYRWRTKMECSEITVNIFHEIQYTIER
jgi:hypothetical protein